MGCCARIARRRLQDLPLGRRMRSPRLPTRNAFTLLELIAAAALVAGTLVPATAIMRRAMELSRDATQRNLLGIYAVRVLETQSAQAMRNWTNATVTGDFSAEGYSSIRYTATRSDDPANGGIIGRLMHIQATIYDDANGNAALDAGEVQVAFRTKVAKLSSYENEPN